ncbi:MAG: sodium-dependent transporter [bacterium]
MEIKRERWGNRAAFVLAAIGSAAGLGNAIRFPYVAYSNGGGAFLIPYFIALITAGIPLLILEFAVGQKNQAGAPTAMERVKKGFQPFGWWPVISAFIIVAYYGGIMGWIWDYLAASFTVAWGNDSGTYFVTKVLQLSDSPGNLGGFSIPVLLGIAATWLFIYFILRKGTNSVGKVVYFTVSAPIILLLILTLRAVTLPGAANGLNFFLRPDFSALLNLRVWIEAYAQVFFTLSLGMGIMYAYASYMPEDSDITNNALITVFANSGVSFLSGIAVFGTLGYMAHQQGVAVADVAAGGLGLSFIVFPNAINMLPGGTIMAVIFGVVFFLTLLTLGIDSAFSLVESTVAGIVDKWGTDKHRTTLWVIVTLALISLLYATKAGMYWVDIVDHYINNYGLIIGGILETVALGWFYKTDTLRGYFNPISEYKFGKWWTYMIKILPVILIVLLINYFYGDITTLYGGYEFKYQLIGGWSLLAILFIGSFILSLTKENALQTIYLFGTAALITFGIAYAYMYNPLIGAAIIFIGNLFWLMFFLFTKYVKTISEVTSFNINPEQGGRL